MVRGARRRLAGRAGTLVGRWQGAGQFGGKATAGLDRFAKGQRQRLPRGGLFLVHVQRPRGEGKLHAQPLGQLEDVDEQPVPLAKLDRPVWQICPIPGRAHGAFDAAAGYSYIEWPCLWVLGMDSGVP